ncbi:MAG: cupin domain-containing protein, partial [Dehalococcoidia bacterium]
LVAAAALAISAGRAAAPPELQLVNLPCATNVFAQPLGQGMPAAAEGKALVLTRVTFEPGGSIGPHTHPGTLVQTIESGVFGFTLLHDGEMSVMRSGDAGTPAVAEPLTVGQEVELTAGDWFVETGMVHSGRSIGDEPAVVVFAGLFEAGQPGTQCVEGTPTP